MSAMIYENGAWKEADTPKTWNGSVFADTDGYCWESGVQKEGWSAEKPLVPIMTSNTTPSGQVIADSTYHDYQPYKAFNGVLRGEDYWHSTRGVNHYIGYIFPTPKRVTMFSYNGLVNSSWTNRIPKSITLQATNNQSTWVDLYTTTNTTPPNYQEKIYYSVANGNRYLGYRLYMTLNSSDYTDCSEVQFYGS